MFILTPIAINSFLTSKRTHVCIPIAITTSLEFSKIPQTFPLVVLLEFSSVRAKEKRLKLSFYCLRVREVSISMDIISQIPTVKVCEHEF